MGPLSDPGRICFRSGRYAGVGLSCHWSSRMVVLGGPDTLQKADLVYVAYIYIYTCTHIHIYIYLYVCLYENM